MCVTTSLFVPAHDVHDGAVPVCDCEPADADARVDCDRVVTDDALALPALPGSPV
jgi:hypothetical protein